MDKETAILNLIEAVKYAQLKGVYTIENAAGLYQSILVLTIKEEIKE